VADSLRFRVPLIISSLIAGVLVLFVIAAYGQVEQTLIHTAGVRAQAAADQLATVFAQGAQQRLNDARRVAREPALRDYLRHPEHGPGGKVEALLETLTSTGQPPVELWNAAGQRLLTVSAMTDTPAPPSLTGEVSVPPAGISPLCIEGNLTYWRAVADVEVDPPAGGEPPTRLGAIVCRRVLAAGAGVDVINRLLGSEAVINLGNRTGNAWSDLSKPVRGPAIDPGRAGTASYRADDGTLRLGAATPMKGTPWTVWVEFPRDTVIAPAQTFLARMLGVVIVFVGLSGLAAYVLGARITGPLQSLTHAAEAIAGGRYDERVAAMRADELGRLGAAFNTMAATIQGSQAELETRVEQRTADVRALNATLEARVAELAALSQELEAFSYSVSHDLRAPVRQVAGYARLLEASAGPSLNERDQRHVRSIADAAARMGRLIDELLTFSRMGRREMLHADVDLSALVESLREEAMSDIAERKVRWTLHPLPVVQGDPSMLRQVFANLLSNALKYTGTRTVAEIEIGASDTPAERVIYVRDNGVGFEMRHVGKLFGVFQRLHGAEEFEGIGVGLANVRRIIARHGGRVWAEGAVDQGATFFLSLPKA
jgi:signal transduction histidine kinase